MTWPNDFLNGLGASYGMPRMPGETSDVYGQRLALPEPDGPTEPDRCPRTGPDLSEECWLHEGHDGPCSWETARPIPGHGRAVSTTNTEALRERLAQLGDRMGVEDIPGSVHLRASTNHEHGAVWWRIPLGRYTVMADAGPPRLYDADDCTTRNYPTVRDAIRALLDATQESP